MVIPSNLLTAPLLVFLALLGFSHAFPECHRIPQVLCCNRMVIENCLAGCLATVQRKCPERIPEDKKAELAETTPSSPIGRRRSSPRQSTSSPRGNTRRVKCYRIPVSMCCHNHIATNCYPGCKRYIKANCPEKSRPEDKEPGEETTAPSGAEKPAVEKPKEPTEPKPDQSVRNEYLDESELSQQTTPAPKDGCGTKVTQWRPCLDKKIANDLFMDCCHAAVPRGCHTLCEYVINREEAHSKLFEVVKAKSCDLKYVSPILYCASQNRDNVECCKGLDLASSALKVGDKCLRLCDFRNSGGVGRLTTPDLVCLGNWDVLMYCHWSGARLF